MASSKELSSANISFFSFSVKGAVSGMPIGFIPAACAALIPFPESSKTKQSLGSAPSFLAARRNMSGFGLHFTCDKAYSDEYQKQDEGELQLL